MTADSARLRVKTWVCVAIVVLSNVAGNFFMKRGLPADLPSPLDYITVLFTPWVALGVLLLLLWMLSRMALFSWADLSYVLPVTSIGYVLVAIAGKLFLNEQITPLRWAGIALIMTGVAIVSRETPQSGSPAADHIAALQTAAPQPSRDREGAAQPGAHRA